MSDKILAKYTGRSLEDAAESTSLSESDGTEDLVSFGWLRGGQRERAVMVELRRKTGNIRAIPYAWIQSIEFDPSEGITLHAGGEKIRITGRNLNADVRPQVRLFQGLARQRVPWVQEADHAVTLQSQKDTVVVETIEW